MLSLEEIIQIIENQEITGYSIAQKTDLTEVGVNKILNGKTKRPCFSGVCFFSCHYGC